MPSEDMYGRDDDELDLRVYLSLLRRRWLVIAVTVLVVVVIVTLVPRHYAGARGPGSYTKITRPTKIEVVKKVGRR
jgi:hypothetical protein